MTEEKISVILAGGKSSRFGSDKLRALFLGKPLIEILIHSLKTGGFTPVISGPKIKFQELKLPILSDEHPFKGPLYALATIWKKLPTNFSIIDKILLVAGDMPFIDANIMEALWNNFHSPDILLLPAAKKVSPLPGIYSRSTHKKIKTLIRQGKSDLMSLIHSNLVVETLDRELFLSLDPRERALVNINTEEDLHDGLS